ncbi:hypothetical protein [Hymenobacter sp. IS2118]|uniref:hypothetical protein n=1 Tax=Hymenobacter sp. IS2118 TaxID=1505605 RepID=UPI0005554CFE|nr:hypothetical protein [Hymenobacter sp. IS2118]
MSRKDYVAYAVFSMVAMCCLFAGKEVFGFFGSVFGGALGMFAGFAALRLLARRSLRFGAYALALVTVVGLSTLYGLVRLSNRTVTVANLQGRWVANDPGGPITLHIRGSTAVLDMEVFTVPHRFALVVAHDSLRLTSAKLMPFAWRVHTLTKTRMDISAKQGVLDFQRDDP